MHASLLLSWILQKYDMHTGIGKFCRFTISLKKLQPVLLGCFIAEENELPHLKVIDSYGLFFTVFL